MNNIFLKDEHLAILCGIFEDYCPNAQIWAYGSRVCGDAHDGSDLDLAVIDFGDKKCSLAELKNILNNSNIPFLIDINEFKNLPKSFQEEIRKKYIKIYPKNEL
ncbi:MAG: nucleotidyltransferase domain-containing protein [Candidatus Gastranaerophilaceae bacterium]